MSSPALIDAARTLRRDLAELTFGSPVTHVYRPLDYAWAMHEAYLSRYGRGRKAVLMLGMNPGPWGMAQTGVPFGEVRAVRDWLRLSAPVSAPPQAHPKRPVQGLACRRSEVSGRRVWALFQQRFTTPQAFFERHWVVNYCPLMFLEASGRNRTPDKLPAHEQQPMLTACDRHLRRVIDTVKPEVLVGVGGYARDRLHACAAGLPVVRILHPSPASPAANRGWGDAVTRQLVESGVWP